MTVLFASVQNAGRSQMAAALFNRAVGGRARGISAGIRPAPMVDDVVREAMREIGLDRSLHTPQRLTPELVNHVDLVVTMDGKDGPYVPGVKRMDWHVDDPQDQPLEQVRAIRDEIEAQVNRLVQDLGL